MSVYYSDCVEFLKEFSSRLEGSISVDHLLSKMRLSKAQYRRLFKVISDILEERSKVDYAASQREEKIAFLVGRLELLNDEIRNLESDEKEAFRKVVAVYNFPVQLTETIEEGD